MQVTDKRIHQVKIELSLMECKKLRKCIDHYLKLFDENIISEPQKVYVEKEIDLETLRALSSHLRLVETSDFVEEMKNLT